MNKHWIDNQSVFFNFKFSFYCASIVAVMIKFRVKDAIRCIKIRRTKNKKRLKLRKKKKERKNSSRKRNHSDDSYTSLHSMESRKKLLTFACNEYFVDFRINIILNKIMCRYFQCPVFFSSSSINRNNKMKIINIIFLI